MIEDYQVVIGLEVHSQLLTESKMFCSCSADYQDAEPNSVVCPVCLGMPGVLPVINRRAVELVVRTGLALGCTIAGHTKFDRKSYLCPDLMKGYQISQYDQPIASNGSLDVEFDGHRTRVSVTRVHLEEDTAKLAHRTAPHGESYSLMDVNRSGVPLMEIVSEPDMRCSSEAVSYLTSLRSIVQYIGASTGTMEEGSFRCDANISVRPRGSSELGTKVEVKNMNSFRSVQRALDYEAERQVRALREGERILQETRGWDDHRGTTVSQRSKEYASDYRYFPDPDLPPLTIDGAWVAELKKSQPELPKPRRARLTEEYGLPEYDARLLTTSRDTADFFESAMGATSLESEARQLRAKAVSNWVLGELTRLLNAAGREISDCKIEPRYLARLVEMVDAGTLNSTMAKAVFEEMFASGGSPEKIADERGMVQITDADAVGLAVAEAVESNPDPVGDYLGGKQTAMRFLVGQVMKITRGKANPQLAAELLRERLESLKVGR